MTETGDPAAGGGTARDATIGGAARDATIAPLTFDAALAELERTVATLETGGTPLEATIEFYERAVALEAHCSRLLADARLRMERLVERGGGRLESDASPDASPDARRPPA
jgi:exodeoxyribonuclease VII small subunit